MRFFRRWPVKDEVVTDLSITRYRRKWDSVLTDRERFNNQMQYKSVDRCFNTEFGYWQENFQRWSMFRDNGIASNGEAHRFFRFDEMAVLGGNTWMSPMFEQQVIEEREHYNVIINPEGLLAEVPKDDHETIPHFIQASVVTPEDWKQVKAERFRRDDPARRVDVEEALARHPEDRSYPLGVACGSMIGKVRDMLTFEGLAYACFDYPDMVEDMVETCCVLVEDFLDQVLPHFSFDFASGWEDICFNSGPLVTVDFFRSVVVPRYKRIAKKLHSAGIEIWYTDCDGDIRPLLPYFLESGINCMFPFEVNASGHPGPVLEQYGRQLRILGGVDKMALVQGRQAIDEYLYTLRPWVERGGFVPHVDHRCPPTVDEADYLYYLDRKQELFGVLD